MKIQSKPLNKNTINLDFTKVKLIANIYASNKI